LKIKAVIITALFLFLCVSGLFTVYFLLEKSGNLFLVPPNTLRSPRIDINTIEEFSENEFILTYENPVPEKVSLPQGEHPVTLIGTNSSYPHIMGLPMSEGSFFSKQAWAGKLRHAVLNERAALIIFGSNQIVNNRFRIRNDTWLVTGVIRDGDDDTARIYVPSSVHGGEAAALALISSGRMDEAYIKNNLKALAIREDSFDFINFETFRRLFLERALTISVLFLIFLLLNTLIPLITIFRKTINTLKTELGWHYLAEILKKRQKTIIKLCFLVLGMICVPVSAVFLLIKRVAVWLPWQDIPSLSGINRDSFYSRLDMLTSLETASLSLFILSLAVLVIFFVCLNRDVIFHNDYNKGV
jgi:hypothetical protein